MGTLTGLYRNYLRLVARSLTGVALRVKLEPSDLIQETFLKAHREFAGFAGRSEHELVAWLRRILARTLADQVKHHRRKGRDLQREESLDLLLARSDVTIQNALASRVSSPSEGAVRREQAMLLADAVVSSRPTIARSLSFVLWSTLHLRTSPSGWTAVWGRYGCSGPGRLVWLNEMLEGEA